MKNIILKNVAFIGLLFIVACSEEVVHEPLEVNSTSPQTVTNIQVENLPGKVRLTYTLPDDQDLQYVKADYTLANGREMEVKSSDFSNTMELEGFTGTNDVEVTLVAVNRSEVKSEASTITVNPLPSPIFDVFDSLNTGEAFGGIFVDAENPTRQELAILVLTKNEEGDWVTDPNSIYTSTDHIREQLRGFDTIPKDFAFTVRDRFLNYTDTLENTITPLFEEAIPKSGYADLRFENDAPANGSTPKSGMWDGDYLGFPRVYLTDGSYTSGDHILSFDMGVEAKLSRIVIWDYPEYYSSGNGQGRAYYYNVCMKKFEIYGSNQLQDTGDLDQWTLLGTYEETKPSGLPYGQNTGEDFETARAGFSWDIDPTAPRMRYIRIRLIENWAGTVSMGIAELQVYGNTNL